MIEGRLDLKDSTKGLKVNRVQFLDLGGREKFTVHGICENR